MMKPPGTLPVLLLYDHKDEELCQKLVTHLHLLQREKLISIWYNRQIAIGTNKAEILNMHLEQASIILLLISNDFMFSEDCTNEMERALERYKRDQTHVYRLALRPVSLGKNDPCAHLPELSYQGKAVTEWPDHDQAFSGIVENLRSVIEKIVSQPGYATDLPQNPIWDVPYSPSRLFIGREKLLSDLHAQLLVERHMALVGMGGVGKTQIALNYAITYRQNYHAIFWASADTHENLTLSYRSIATLLNLPGKDTLENVHVINAVKTWLQGASNWLLILDNAEDLPLVKTFLPLLDREKGNHILLTTRIQATRLIAHPLKVEDLSIEEGAHFLLLRTGQPISNTNLKQARDIYTELGGLPLALEQAGAYIEKTQCGLVGYLQRYRASPTYLLGLHSDLVGDHPESVVATFSLNFDKVKSKNLAAAELLCFCAYLAPNAIPEEIITRGATHLGSLLESIVASHIALDAAIEELGNYSLIHRENTILSVHPLVKEVLKKYISSDKQKQWGMRALQVIEATFPPVTFEAWKQCDLWLPHALVCAMWIDEEKIVSLQAANILLYIGRYMHERGEYGEVEHWYEESLAMRNLLHFADDALIEVRGYLANLYSERGMYPQAQDLYEQCLEIRKATPAPDECAIASLFNNLAILKKVDGNYEEAEQLHKRNLAIREHYLASDPLAVATALNNLGVLYAEYGRYEEAKPLFERSLAMRKQFLTPTHTDIAQSLGNLANLLTELHDWKKAEALYKRALRILEEAQGDKHPNVAYILNGLAVLFIKQNKYPRRAKDLLMQSQHIWQEYLDPKHPQIAYAINNQALLLKRQGKYAEAEPLYRECLEIFKSLGPQHPHRRTCALHYADTLNTQAHLAQDKTAYEKVLSKYPESLDILDLHLGVEHHATRLYAWNCARLLRLLTREAEAQHLEDRYDLTSHPWG